MKIKESRGDRIFGAVVNVILALCMLTVIYPLYLVVINSFSDPDLVSRGKVFLLPQGFQLDAYKQVFKDGSMVTGYKNTLVYTVVGTALSMVITIPAAYALSKKKLVGRGIVMKLIVFTMHFSGGLIPTFVVLSGLGLVNSRWSVLLIGAVASSNLIVARTFFASSIPGELEEAAEIDGCSPLQSFLKIALPLSKAMLGVLTLYYAVARWNSYTSALYYLPYAKEKWPLQMVLRELITLVRNTTAIGDPELEIYYANLFNQIKYAVIVVASVPLLCVYPFIQKYFDKGVMMGSVKG